MQWPKAKNLIIVLLLAVNIFLLSWLAVLGTSEKFVSEDFAVSSAKLLEQSGLTISPDDIPLEISDAPSIMYSVGVDGYILLQPLSALENDILIEDGSITGAYYKSDAGTVNVHFDGSFTFRASEVNTEKAPSQARAKALALNFAQLTGIPASSFSLTHSSKNDNGYFITFRQLINGLSVEGYGIRVKITGKSVEYAEGRLLLTRTGEVSDNSLPSSVNALFSVAATLQEELTVRNMGLCYFPADEEDHSFTVCTPSYRIETDKGVLFYLLTSGQIYWE